MPYTLRRTWPHDPRANQDDYVVKCDGKDVGRMCRTIGTGGRLVWLWTIYGASLADRSDTFEDAKRQRKAAFESRAPLSPSAHPRA